MPRVKGEKVITIIWPFLFDPHVATIRTLALVMYRALLHAACLQALCIVTVYGTCTMHKVALV